MKRNTNRARPLTLLPSPAPHCVHIIHTNLHPQQSLKYPQSSALCLRGGFTKQDWSHKDESFSGPEKRITKPQSHKLLPMLHSTLKHLDVYMHPDVPALCAEHPTHPSLLFQCACPCLNSKCLAGVWRDVGWRLTKSHAAPGSSRFWPKALFVSHTFKFREKFTLETCYMHC